MTFFISVYLNILEVQKGRNLENIKKIFLCKPLNLPQALWREFERFHVYTCLKWKLYPIFSFKVIQGDSHDKIRTSDQLSEFSDKL